MATSKTTNTFNRHNSEDIDFPILCQSCLGVNPCYNITKEIYDKECKICDRLFTVFRWWPEEKMNCMETEICQSCCKVKNVCQSCLLNLDHCLPIQVRNVSSKRKDDLPPSSLLKSPMKISFKESDVFRSCNKVKNFCQTCLLNLEYGLPIEVTDVSLMMKNGIPSPSLLVPPSKEKNVCQLCLLNFDDCLPIQVRYVSTNIKDDLPPPSLLKTPMKMSFKESDICHTCSKMKNFCPTCLTNLEYGLPIQVRDVSLMMSDDIPLPSLLVPPMMIRYKESEVCLICSKVKNVCQTCSLNLDHGLPIQDVSLKMKYRRVLY